MMTPAATRNATLPNATARHRVPARGVAATERVCIVAMGWEWSVDDVSALGRTVVHSEVESPGPSRTSTAGGVDRREAAVRRLAAARADASLARAEGVMAWALACPPPRDVPGEGVRGDAEQALATLCGAAGVLRGALDACKAYGVAVLGAVFPELGELVASSADFARVVAAWVAVRGIGFGRDEAAAAMRRAGPAGAATALRVAVAAAATRPDADWGGWADLGEVFGAASAAAGTAERVGMAMAVLVERDAPNLAAVVGPEVAAGLVTEAGGLRVLACMPSCAVQTLADASGGAAAPRSRTGLVATCPAVADLPAALRDRAVRLVAAKAVLAARVDALGGVQGGEDMRQGEALAGQVRERIARWQEPPRRREVRAEPIPQPLKVKKRGGRRARKLKEKHALSRAAKRATKVALGAGASDVGYIQRDGFEADL